MIALALTASMLPMSPGAAQIERARFEPRGAVARADVRVRIISGMSIKLGRSPNDPEIRMRSASILIDGEPYPARLTEFP
ncbi:MAG: hypothetical protein M3N02_01695 [Pseudomonadota bacterium]|nr:hypothetical protein [Pseudomonadota bacterium]